MKHFQAVIVQTDLRDPADPRQKRRTYFTVEAFIEAIKAYQAIESGHVAIEIRCKVGIESLEYLSPKTS
jgi:hypothetical protein